MSTIFELQKFYNSHRYALILKTATGCGNRAPKRTKMMKKLKNIKPRGQAYFRLIVRELDRNPEVLGVYQPF